MKEFVQKVVVKPLVIDMIYVISVNQQISPVQVVPNKSGITMIKNNRGKLILTRQIMG